MLCVLTDLPSVAIDWELSNGLSFPMILFLPNDKCRIMCDVLKVDDENGCTSCTVKKTLQLLIVKEV